MTETTVRVVLANSPAVYKPEWLPPDTGFEELEELRQDHVALLTELRDLGRVRLELEWAYEQEDNDALARQRQAARDGKPEPKLPKRTAPEAREAALAELNERTRSRRAIFGDLVNDIVATIQDHRDEWCAQLGEGEAAAQAHVEDLRRQLAEAEAVAAAAPRLRMWVERTALNRSGWHVDWKSLSQPVATMLEIANRGGNFAAPPVPLPTAGGGVDPDTHAVPDYSDETIDYSSAEYQQALERTIGDWNRRQTPSETGAITP